MIVLTNLKHLSEKKWCILAHFGAFWRILAHSLGREIKNPPNKVGFIESRSVCKKSLCMWITEMPVNLLQRCRID
jgi:hypothetical protein